MVNVLLRARPNPSCPPTFSVPGACKKNVAGQRTSALGYEPEEKQASNLVSFGVSWQVCPRQRSSSLFPKVHNKITVVAYPLLRVPPPFLIFRAGAKKKCYNKVPPLDNFVAGHLCPHTAISWKAKAAHPSKLPLLAGRAYSLAGQAASMLHSVAVLQAKSSAP
ncbi:hypothetical protein Q8A67_000150 [Cirrhinus molitorella]|uniref:Uncharacterized protein n=1 Tax=Cirrhinus molitorella TaxID=172907 RepID=A0AA88U6H0_9TELE|nr:hypothetical protein Q8A67_000150 [Cirrhinus molitorella]